MKILEMDSLNPGTFLYVISYDLIIVYDLTIVYNLTIAYDLIIAITY